MNWGFSQQSFSFKEKKQLNMPLVYEQEAQMQI